MSVLDSLFARLRTKKATEELSQTAAYRKLRLDVAEDRINADHIEAALDACGKTLDDLANDVKAFEHRKELKGRVDAGDKAARELETVRAAQEKANEAYQAAVQAFESTMGPLGVQAEELQLVINNGDQGRKMLEASAGQLDPTQLEPFAAERDAAMEKTQEAFARASAENAAISHEFHAMSQFGDEAHNKQRNALFAKLRKHSEEVLKPIQDAREAIHEKYRAAMRRPEMV